MYRQFVAQTMTKIYNMGLTSTSGGNISVLDKNGDMYITPSSIDKGALTSEDICKITAGGNFSGKHKPSIEHSLHRRIYNARGDIFSIIHAHPPVLTALSLAGVLPKSLFFEDIPFLKKLTRVSYACPGSEKLAQNVESAFSLGYFAALMDNHGVIVGGKNLGECFLYISRLCDIALTYLNALSIGNSNFAGQERERISYSGEEVFCDTSKTIKNLCARGVLRGVLPCSRGSFSVRHKDGFIITAEGEDLSDPKSFLYVKAPNEKSEAFLHYTAYRDKSVQSVIVAAPPYASAYGDKLDTKLVPESYMVLRPKTYTFLPGRGFIITADTPAKAFDRLEVLEYTARAVLLARNLSITPISESDICRIEKMLQN